MLSRIWSFDFPTRAALTIVSFYLRKWKGRKKTSLLERIRWDSSLGTGHYSLPTCPKHYFFSGILISPILLTKPSLFLNTGSMLEGKNVSKPIKFTVRQLYCLGLVLNFELPWVNMKIENASTKEKL